MGEIEHNEYLYERMKKNFTSSTTSTNIYYTNNNNNNNKKKTRWSKNRRGFNLRVKLKRFLVRTRISPWLRLRLRCLSRALKSLFCNTTTTTTASKKRNGRSKTMFSDHSYYYNNNNHQHQHQYSYVRSNSFYAEAIAECLEFIKRSSSNYHRHHDHEQQPHKLLLA